MTEPLSPEALTALAQRLRERADAAESTAVALDTIARGNGAYRRAEASDLRMAARVVEAVALRPAAFRRDVGRTA